MVVRTVPSSILLIVMLLSFATVVPTADQAEAKSNSVSQLAQIYASDAKSYDDFGKVAVDGDTIVAGAPQDLGPNGEPGKAYVFVKPSEGWKNTTQTAELTASDAAVYAGFGESVAISGNTVVVGAPNAMVGANEGQGQVYVFVKPTTGWTNTTETARLTASDGTAFDVFGQKVSISGKVVVASAPVKGAQYVFVKPPGGWTNMTETAKLTVSDGSAVGTANSISGDTVVATGSNGILQTGAAYVFIKPPGGWTNTTETAKLTGSDSTPDDQYGLSASISGGTIVVGATSANVGVNERQGAAYVYVEPQAGWSDMTETAKLTASDGVTNAYLGDSVDVKGNIVITGSPGATAIIGSGAAYVFIKPSRGWQTTSAFNAKLEATSARGILGQFGFSVGLSGTTVVAGSGADIGKRVSQGTAFVFGP